MSRSTAIARSISTQYLHLTSDDCDAALECVVLSERQAGSGVFTRTAVAANEDDDAESTLAMSADESECLVARSFHADDEITTQAHVNVVAEALRSMTVAPARAVASPLSSSTCPPFPLLTPRRSDSWFSERPSITPEEARAARLAREAVRRAKAEAAHMRLVVLGIWGLAVTLAMALAVVATGS
jgi:hypothetical protein